MRHWLLTNTTFGTWLPGNKRGSVTSVRDRRKYDAVTLTRFEHDRPGEPWEGHLPGIHRSALRAMKGPPIYLTLLQAKALLVQFQETANYRGRTLHAVSIMQNHFHIIVTVPGDPNPDRVLADFKAYGSRVLNRSYGKPASNTWWTTKGSVRKLSTASAFDCAINYVLHKQPSPLVIWSPDPSPTT